MRSSPPSPPPSVLGLRFEPESGRLTPFVEQRGRRAYLPALFARFAGVAEARRFAEQGYGRQVRFEVAPGPAGGGRRR